MKVVLLQDIPKIGRKGDVKELADGYARNSLIPQKKVELATQASIQKIETLKSKEEKARIARKDELVACVARFVDEPLTITQTANEDGTLFAAVSGDEFARAISARCNIVIDVDRDLAIHAPIKTTGEHTISLTGMPMSIIVIAK